MSPPLLCVLCQTLDWQDVRELPFCLIIIVRLPNKERDYANSLQSSS
ncbi:hypothetical protein KSD_43960 [Ktedonobacter sp. SOSP1-85]|nr:hypothetical protein KSD_43960 [Ktedonobacter sp. SOSP1-85]